MEHISHSARYALLIDLIKKLHAKGSWCGETHLQKATFIVQDLVKSRFGYKFVMYKHGPYSFDLKSEIDAMKASNIIDFVFPRSGYGASIKTTDFGERLYETNKQEIKEYQKACQFVANWFSSEDVKYLEKVATAYFVTSKHVREPVASRAKRLNSLKPHVDMAAAEEAVRIVDQKRTEAKQQIPA